MSPLAILLRLPCTPPAVNRVKLSLLTARVRTPVDGLARVFHEARIC